jgi:hypothetical protein
MPGTIEMGTERPFVSERLVVAVLAGRSGLPAGARAALEERFGPVDYASDPVPWSFSAYYDREMGPGIVRLFWSFERLVDPADLASIKRATNAIEDAFRVGGDRTLDLDPGLLSLSRFVLATTKDGSHRVPLRDGIYAEVTLVFESGEFRPLPWTYPDYRDPAQLAVLEVLRERYREALRRERG